MRKNLVLLVLLGFTLLSLQGTGAMASGSEYYTIGVHPVEPDRGVRSGECAGKWNMPIPGLMETTEGFKGNKSLQPLTPIIFSKEYLGKEIPAHKVLTLWGCGNGFMASIPLDTTKALGIFCNTPSPIPTPTPVQPTLAPVSVAQISPVAVIVTGPPTVRIWAEVNGAYVSEVKKGTSVNIHWESSNTDRCDALTGLGFNADGKVSGATWVTLTQKGSYRYSVQCHGTGGYVVGETSVYAKGGNATGWILGGLALVAIGIGLGGHGGSSGHGPAGPSQIQ